MQQLSGMDAAFVHLETPTTPMQVVGVIVLDTGGMTDPFTLDRLRSTLEQRIHLIPPFRRRLVEVPLHLDRPYWVEEAPDLDRHLFAITAPSPGDDHALGRVAGDLAAKVLDHNKPLWEMWLVEGLADDKVAIVAKMHHATMYGLAGADLIGHIFDLDAAGTTIDPPEEPLTTEATPSAVTLLRHAARYQVTAPVRLAREVVSSTRNLATTAAGVARRRFGDAPSSLRLAPRSPLNGALTAEREVAVGRVSLAEVKAVKNAVGGTVNDVILALVAQALRRYFISRGEDPTTPLSISVPVAVGEGQVETTDRIGAMLVSLPIHIDDPLDQLHQIVATTKQSKSLTNSLGPDVFGNWADLTAPPLLIAGARLYSNLQLANLHRPLQNLVVSNVPGPPIPLFTAGARVDAIYPLGPLLPGSGLNITVLSNQDNIDFGLLACPDLVPDLWSIPAALAPTLEALTTATAG
jgi:WS/DGAT/MGAT family acyltransferase